MLHYQQREILPLHVAVFTQSDDGKKPTSVEHVVKLVTDLTGPPSRILRIRRGSQVLMFKVGPGRLGSNLVVAPVTRSAGQVGQKQ